ncbi:hypothetical protein B0H17DRAFT_1210911 [Mycena rosella]|uniref:Uncharacterized protein n=1 Tax=Mycena rosella TaxID=1033263 RepID=A0AAD7CV30_MYCRO|nr:hypothetical protein B0H17DRAFT_1210911 [Mycena rosella]
MKLTELGQDILLEICAQITQGITLSSPGMTHHAVCIFPGPPAQILLDLTTMHSELTSAMCPYIWHKILLHIVPFVHALFLLFHFPYGDAEATLPPIVSVLPCFATLHSMCLSMFQSDVQPCMYMGIAAVLRVHPMINTLSMCSMVQCANFITLGSPKVYALELDFCHGDSAVLLLHLAAVRSFRLQNYKLQNLRKNWPADIWDALEHLEPGPEDMEYLPENHWIICASLKKYLEQGCCPALKSLNLSDLPAKALPYWLALICGLDLDVFTYDPYEDTEYDTLERNTSQPNVLDLLSGFPRLKHLTLSVELPSNVGEDLENDYAV